MIDSLPPLRDIIRDFDLDAKKSLGQNFLLDLNITSKVARTAGALDQHVILEIGPGPGGLTRALLAHGAAHVIAIERDPRCVAALQMVVEAYPGRLTVIEADAMRFDPVPLLAGRRAKIVANLPYNIGTQLLIDWIRQDWPPFYDSMTLMFQREVARRIVATHETPDEYGRLGILTGWRMKANMMFDLPPSAFTPPPKVTSSVVHLLPRPSPALARLETLEAVTGAAFSQRRKMLRQSLKSLGYVAEMLAFAGLDGSERPENLPVQTIVNLANGLDAARQAGSANTADKSA